ncbi:MAG: hypothetical protein JST65_16190 [Acidobacteria bacterium]|nr:hypothetical protein [Acidobacteriota bacterium]
MTTNAFTFKALTGVEMLETMAWIDRLGGVQGGYVIQRGVYTITGIFPPGFIPPSEPKATPVPPSPPEPDDAALAIMDWLNELEAEAA